MVSGPTINIGQLLARIVFRDQSAPGIRTANANLRGFEGRIRGARLGLNNLSTQLGSIATQAGIMGAALSAVSGLAVREFGNVEAAGARIVGQTAITAEEFSELEPRIIAIGQQFGITANQALDAFFTIASAGIEGERALEVFSATAQGVASQFGDITELTQLAITITAAWADENISASRIMDVLAGAVEQGNFQASQLASTFPQAASSAAAAGIEFEELASVLATMSRVQPNLNRNVTGFLGLLRLLVNPVAEFGERLEALGINTQQFGRIIADQGITEAAFLIRDAIGEDEVALAQLFASNQEAATGFNNLTAAGRATASQIRNDVVNSVGAADATFQAFDGTVNLLTSQRLAVLRGVLADMGEALVPLVTRVITALTAVLRFFSDEMERGNTAVGVLVIALGVIGPLLLAVSAAISGLLLPLKLLSAAIAVLNFVMALNPVFAIIIGITAMIAALVIAVRYWEQIWNFVTGIGRLIGGIFGISFGSNEDADTISRELPDEDETGIRGDLPSFQGGGRVPGALGEPVLAIVHGGEYVLPAPANASTLVSNNTTTNTQSSVGDISINISGGGRDARDIAIEVREQIEELAFGVTTSARTNVDT